MAAQMGLPFPLLETSLVFAIAARLSLAVVGAVIFWRRSDEWMALLMSGSLMAVLVEGGYGDIGVLNIAQIALFGIGAALFIPIPFIFPNGRFEPGWMRWIAPPFTMVYAGVVVAGFYVPQVSGITAALTLIWSLLAAYAMGYRYFRGSTALERQQIKWVLIGFSVALLTGVYYTAINAAFPMNQPSPARVTALLINVVLYPISYGFFALSILLAMLRHRLWDIDVIIRRTLQYSLLSGLLALIYFGGVALLQGLLSRLTGQAQSPLVVVGSTLLIAALFNPLRLRIRAFIDRRFYRARYDAERTLARFAATARDEVDIERLTDALLGAVEDTMQPRQIALWLERPADPAPPSSGKAL